MLFGNRIPMGFSRDRVHVLLSIDTDKSELKGVPETTRGGDYPQAWWRNFGKGRTFYTSLGHRDEIWSNDPVFRAHVSRRHPLGAGAGTVSRSMKPGRRGRLALVLMAIMILWALGRAQSVDSPSTARGEWPTYGGDLASSKYSPLDQIRREQLLSAPKIAWRVKTPDAVLSMTLSDGAEWTAELRRDLRRAESAGSKALARRRSRRSSTTSRPLR